LPTLAKEFIDKHAVDMLPIPSSCSSTHQRHKHHSRCTGTNRHLQWQQTFSMVTRSTQFLQLMCYTQRAPLYAAVPAVVPSG
jgi:hypothetical protein